MKIPLRTQKKISWQMHQVLTIIEENDNEGVNIEDKLFIRKDFSQPFFFSLVAKKNKMFG